MIAKRMAEPRVCDGCSQADTCKEAYRKLGCVEGPSMTREVLIAFLLPIVVFVAALGGFGYLLKDVVAKPYQTPLALVSAVLTTAALMLVVRALVRRHRKE